MSDRDAFLRAIIDNPGDDAPRLVYADWLEEHGDPARGEFIRLQCELGRILLGTQAAYDRYTAIHRRCGTLLSRHHTRWLQELGPLPPNHRMHFRYRRGMVTKVVCPVEDFLTHGHHLFDVTPVDEFELRGFGPAHAQRLTVCSWSRRVRRFRYVSLDGEDGRMVRSLLAEWPFPELQTFELRIRDPWRDQWARVPGAIAESACLGTLRRLSLARCEIRDAGGQALADSPHLADLAVLDLTDNPLSPAVRYQLQDRFGWRVIFDHRDHAGFRVGDLFG
jgi:uncharacterized protein (TIGR02996 family)